MYLVNIHGAAVDVACSTFFEPFAVMPVKAIDIVGFGCRCRRCFKMIRIRVAFQKAMPVLRFYTVFIGRIFRQFIDNSFKNSAAYMHHMIFCMIPVAKISHNAYFFGARCPHPENRLSVFIVRTQKSISIGACSVCKFSYIRYSIHFHDSFYWTIYILTVFCAFFNYYFSIFSFVRVVFYLKIC